jgi:protein associated with RNAse G/E
MYKTATKVQQGVYYCPHNEFFAFDLHDGSKYLDYDIAVKIFQEAKLFYAESLFIGTLEEALKYPNTFTTTLPAK